MPPRRDRFVTLCQQFLALGLVLAVAAPATSIVTLNIVAPGGGDSAPATQDQAALVAAEPVAPTVEEYPVAAVEPAPAERGTGARGAQRIAPENQVAALSAPAPVEGYATVGVTWAHGVEIDHHDISVDVRTQTDGVWSSWTEAHYDDAHAPDPDSEEARNARPGTDALVVGDVDEVQVRATTATGTAPADMRLAVIDPGETVGTMREKPAIDTAELSSATTPATEGSTTGQDVDAAPAAELAAGTTHRPQIFSRAQWGADERLRRSATPTYFEVHAGFVHHTVNTNDYTRDQVPSLMRGIYAYHTQSRGWSDVGYNYIVDRFGRIWEGRFGGVDRPVVGAHTLGYNEYSFAMSALGNFDVKQPSIKMVRAYGRLLAWKLALHGVDASSRSQRVGPRTFPAINGHRDAGSTACPGRYLYAKLPQIRTLAAGHQADWTSRDRTTRIAGAHPDLVVREAGTNKAFVVSTGGQLGFKGVQTALRGWASKDLVLAPGDLNNDGAADVMARDKTTKRTHIFLGDGKGGFGGPVRSSPKFRAMDQLVGVGDFNGDGRADLVGRVATSKHLFLYRGRGNGGFKKRLSLAKDWSAYALTTGAGDLTGDGKADIVARHRDGRLLLFPGDGRRLGTARVLAPNWRAFDAVTGGRDLTGDGIPDLVARYRTSENKATYVYPGTTRGVLSHRIGPFAGPRSLRGLSVAGQVRGDGKPDLVGVRNGQLVVVVHGGGSNVQRVIDAKTSFANTNLILNVGDWNGDGRGDVLTRAAKGGNLWFRAGLGNGTFGPSVLAAQGFKSVRLLAAVGDVTGDGYPDLMGQPANGSMRIYPGNGATGFLASFVAHSPIPGDAQAGIGRWDADGAPDTLVRNKSSLVLYRGNGPGGLLGGAKVGTISTTYDWVLGSGDVNGDRLSDLLVREKATGYLWLLPGNGKGFGARRFVAEGFERYNLGG